MRIDLQAYLNRIGLQEPLEASFETLRKMHFRHVTTIPFENLDIHLDVPISIKLADLQKKLVERKRGGYCFEQNSLFQAMLSATGFQVDACEARVRMGRSFLNPRTHMLLLVPVDGRTFLCDVGFGGDGLLEPVPLDGSECIQFLWTYRAIKEGALYVLQSKKFKEWIDLYAFSPERAAPIDFEVANWYTSTHPDSRFVQTLTAQRAAPEAKYILRNRTFIIDKGGVEESIEIQTPEELLNVLRDTFHLDFPAGTRFRGFGN